MDDLISRQKVIDALADMHCKSDEDGYVWIIRSDAWARIDALPSVTPEQKRGKWETVEDWDGDEHYRCSECGAEFVLIDGTPEDNDNYFCPHCGARMTEEDV